MVFPDFFKKGLLIVLTLKNTTRGEDAYDTFKFSVAENDLWEVSTATDGAPSMMGKLKWFVQLGYNDNTFPFFFSCIPHHYALCGQIMKMEYVMKTVILWIWYAQNLCYKENSEYYYKI